MKPGLSNESPIFNGRTYTPKTVLCGLPAAFCPYRCKMREQCRQSLPKYQNITASLFTQACRFNFQNNI